MVERAGRRRRARGADAPRPARRADVGVVPPLLGRRLQVPLGARRGHVLPPRPPLPGAPDGARGRAGARVPLRRGRRDRRAALRGGQLRELPHHLRHGHGRGRQRPRGQDRARLRRGRGLRPGRLVAARRLPRHVDLGGLRRGPLPGRQLHGQPLDGRVPGRRAGRAVPLRDPAPLPALGRRGRLRRPRRRRQRGGLRQPVGPGLPQALRDGRRARGRVGRARAGRRGPAARAVAAAALARRPPVRGDGLRRRVLDVAGLPRGRDDLRDARARELRVGAPDVRRRGLRRAGRLPGPLRRPDGLRQGPAQRRVRLADGQPEQGAVGRLDAPHAGGPRERVQVPRARRRRERRRHGRLRHRLHHCGGRAGPPHERRGAAADARARRRRQRRGRGHVALRVVGAAPRRQRLRGDGLRGRVVARRGRRRGRDRRDQRRGAQRVGHVQADVRRRDDGRDRPRGLRPGRGEGPRGAPDPAGRARRAHAQGRLQPRGRRDRRPRRLPGRQLLVGRHLPHGVARRDEPEAVGRHVGPRGDQLDDPRAGGLRPHRGPAGPHGHDPPGQRVERQRGRPRVGAPPARPERPGDQRRRDPQRRGRVRPGRVDPAGPRGPAAALPGGVGERLQADADGGRHPRPDDRRGGQRHDLHGRALRHDGARRAAAGLRPGDRGPGLRERVRQDDVRRPRPRLGRVVLGARRRRERARRRAAAADAAGGAGAAAPAAGHADERAPPRLRRQLAARALQRAGLERRRRDHALPRRVGHVGRLRLARRRAPGLEHDPRRPDVGRVRRLHHVVLRLHHRLARDGQELHRARLRRERLRLLDVVVGAGAALRGAGAAARPAGRAQPLRGGPHGPPGGLRAVPGRGRRAGHAREARLGRRRAAREDRRRLELALLARRGAAHHDVLAVPRPAGQLQARLREPRDGAAAPRRGGRRRRGGPRGAGARRRRHGDARGGGLRPRVVRDLRGGGGRGRLARRPALAPRERHEPVAGLELQARRGARRGDARRVGRGDDDDGHGRVPHGGHARAPLRRLLRADRPRVREERVAPRLVRAQVRLARRPRGDALPRGRRVRGRGQGRARGHRHGRAVRRRGAGDRRQGVHDRVPRAAGHGAAAAGGLDAPLRLAEQAGHDGRGRERRRGGPRAGHGLAAQGRGRGAAERPRAGRRRPVRLHAGRPGGRRALRRVRGHVQRRAQRLRPPGARDARGADAGGGAVAAAHGRHQAARRGVAERHVDAARRRRRRARHGVPRRVGLERGRARGPARQVQGDGHRRRLRARLPGRHDAADPGGRVRRAAEDGARGAADDRRGRRDQGRRVLRRRLPDERRRRARPRGLRRRAAGRRRRGRRRRGRGGDAGPGAGLRRGHAGHLPPAARVRGRGDAARGAGGRGRRQGRRRQRLLPAVVRRPDVEQDLRRRLGAGDGDGPRRPEDAGPRHGLGAGRRAPHDGAGAARGARLARDVRRGAGRRAVAPRGHGRRRHAVQRGRRRARPPQGHVAVRERHRGPEGRAPALGVGGRRAARRGAAPLRARGGVHARRRRVVGAGRRGADGGARRRRADAARRAQGERRRAHVPGRVLGRPRRRRRRPGDALPRAVRPRRELRRLDRLRARAGRGPRVRPGPLRPRARGPDDGHGLLRARARAQRGGLLGAAHGGVARRRARLPHRRRQGLHGLHAARVRARQLRVDGGHRGRRHGVGRRGRDHGPHGARVRRRPRAALGLVGLRVDGEHGRRLRPRRHEVRLRGRVRRRPRRGARDLELPGPLRPEVGRQVRRDQRDAGRGAGRRRLRHQARVPGALGADARQAVLGVADEPRRGLGAAGAVRRPQGREVPRRVGLEPRVQHDQRPRRGLRERAVDDGRPGRRERQRGAGPDGPLGPPVPDPGPRAGPELLGARVGLERQGLRRRPGLDARERAAGGPAPGPAGERLGVRLARRVPRPPARRLQPAARRPERLRANDARRQRARQGGQLPHRVVRVVELPRRRDALVRLARAPGRRRRPRVRGLRRRRRLGLRRRRRPVLLRARRRGAVRARLLRGLGAAHGGLLQAALRRALVAADAARREPRDVARRVRQRLGPGRQLRLRRRRPDEGLLRAHRRRRRQALRHQPDVGLPGGRALGPRRQRDAAHGLHAGPGRARRRAHGQDGRRRLRRGAADDVPAAERDGGGRPGPHPPADGRPALRGDDRGVPRLEHDGRQRLPLPRHVHGRRLLALARLQAGDRVAPDGGGPRPAVGLLELHQVQGPGPPGERAHDERLPLGHARPLVRGPDAGHALLPAPERGERRGRRRRGAGRELPGLPGPAGRHRGRGAARPHGVGARLRGARLAHVAARDLGRRGGRARRGAHGLVRRVEQDERRVPARLGAARRQHRPRLPVQRLVVAARRARRARVPHHEPDGGQLLRRRRARDQPPGRGAARVVHVRARRRPQGHPVLVRAARHQGHLRGAPPRRGDVPLRGRRRVLRGQKRRRPLAGARVRQGRGRDSRQ